MSSQPQLLSNELEDFVQAGLYPGGSGVLKSIEYQLWDYNGKRPPNSQVAVHALLTPTDGSNDGKDVEIFWSVGPATDFQPDHSGGFLIGVGKAVAMRMNSNWHFVLSKFRDTCGLETGKLSQPNLGIKALAGSELTMTRMDQPHRDIEEEPAAAGTQERGRKPTLLVPTRAKFPWEKKGKAAAKPAAASTAAAPALAAATSATSNGSGPVSADLAVNLKAILDSNGGSVEFSSLPKLINEHMGPSATAKSRVDAMKQVKDPAILTTIAEENGWVFDGTLLAG